MEKYHFWLDDEKIRDDDHQSYFSSTYVDLMVTLNEKLGIAKANKFHSLGTMNCWNISVADWQNNVFSSPTCVTLSKIGASVEVNKQQINY